MTKIEADVNGILTAVAKTECAPENVQKVMCSIVQSVTEEIKAKGCCLALLTPDKQYLRHVSCHGISEEYIKKGRILAQKSISEVLEGTVVTVLDAYNDSRIQYPEETRQEGIVSILAVPVSLRNEVLGVLRVYMDRPRRFTEHDIYFVRTAADIGAKILEDAVKSDSNEPDYDVFRQQLVELEWARWPGQCV